MTSRAVGATLLVLLACAKMEPPPGGPADVQPPRVVAVRPDSLRVLPDFGDAAEFLFDEVISEGTSPNQGLGTGDLERLIILSPSEEVPRVGWKRNRITVKPKEGWQPNRVYRVELLPGIVDLRRNRSDTSVVITFTTGAAAPQHRLVGRVLDWTRGQAAPRALVQAELLPDRLAYRSLSDSTGAFVLDPLPDGDYVVVGVLDENRNQRRDPREAFDTVRVGPGQTEVGEIWTFPHDTVGPRMQSIAVRDSLSATIAFSQFLDPTTRYDTTSVRVWLMPDSTAIGVTAIRTPAEDDSVIRAQTADTLAAVDTLEAADSAARQPLAPTPTPRRAESRPALSDRLVLRVATPWVPGGAYMIEMRGVRNVNGVAADASAGLQVPEPPPTPPALPDSLAPTPAVPGDSLPPAQPDSGA
jgi:hypothetical protein